jgi:hypothetical protein
MEFAAEFMLDNLNASDLYVRRALSVTARAHVA